MHLWLSHQQAKLLIQHVRSQAPNEACGLIAGKNGRATYIVPIDNIAANPTIEYELDHQQQVEAMVQFQQEKLDLLAIYHSHPNTPPIPSQTDIRNATYPDALYLIIGLEKDAANLAAWHLRGTEVERVSLHIGNEAPQIESQDLTPLTRTAILITTVLVFIAVIAYSIYLLPPAPPIPTPGG